MNKTREIFINKQIIIVCSPLVQKNFRLQLFDENKLEFKDNKWTINNCAGNNFLDEILRQFPNLSDIKKTTKYQNKNLSARCIR